MSKKEKTKTEEKTEAPKKARKPKKTKIRAYPSHNEYDPA